MDWGWGILIGMVIGVLITLIGVSFGSSISEKKTDVK
jgi:tetrahydromethanopterin S-methyltransferase subunit G